MNLPRLIARVIPWDKETAVAAIESGVEALWVPDGRASSARELGRVVTACAEGDLREGTDFRVTRVEGKEDETRIAGSPPDAAWVVFPRDREIIPLENLVAWGRRILVVARTPADVSLYRGILEQGVYGLVLDARNPVEMRALGAAALARTEDVSLVPARVVEVVPLGMGDRVCVDTCTWIEGSRGMLVGNGSAGMFLVCAENVPNPYVLPRPFRVNAGAVHSYCRVPGGRTAYLSELVAGSGVLLVDDSGGERRRGSAGRRWSAVRWCWSAPSAPPGTSIRSYYRMPRRSVSWDQGAKQSRSPGSRPGTMCCSWRSVRAGTSGWRSRRRSAKSSGQPAAIGSTLEHIGPMACFPKEGACSDSVFRSFSSSS